MAQKRKPVPKVEQNSSEDEEQLNLEAENASDDDDEEEEEVEEEEEEEEEEEGEESEADDEEEDEGSKRESVRKLLEPFGKDQLIEILKEAALKNSSIISRISQAAESDAVHRKIFVHGLGWDATREAVISVFKQFGQIEDCNVVTDKLTGKNKGFCFVLFKTREGAQKALKEPQKKIGNRMTACQLASYGPVVNHQAPDSSGRKLFVGNVGPHIHPENLRLFFTRFGEIEEGPLGYDRATMRFKGFAIFVYKTIEGCNRALEEPVKLFEGCMLQCRRAVEGLRVNKNPMSSVATGSATVFPPNDFALNYAMGFSPGMMGHSPGVGLLNPALGTSISQTGLPPSVGNGFSPSVNRSAAAPSQLGLSSGFGGQSGINSISPSVIGSYGSQAALRGLGAYQSAHLGLSPAAAAAAMRSQPGNGSLGTFPSYFGR